MKQIRQQVWETNSSSTHSLSIVSVTPETILGTIHPTYNSEKNCMEIVLTGDEFGWEWMRYTEPIDKANYLYTYALTWAGGWRDLKDGEIDPTREKFLNVLTEVIEKQTGYPVAFGKREDGYWENGYIDHQSAESNDYDYLFNDPEKMRDFIFNTKSILFTGNDNDYAPPLFYDEVGTQYKYKLVFPLFPELATSYFKEYPSNDDIREELDRYDNIVYNPLTKEFLIKDYYSIAYKDRNLYWQKKTWMHNVEPIDFDAKTVLFASDEIDSKATYDDLKGKSVYLEYSIEETDYVKQ